jgi:hypothetical protein
MKTMVAVDSSCHFPLLVRWISQGGNISIGRMYLGPGYSWEKYVKHIVKTDSWQFSHTQYDVPEEVRVTMNDRSEEEHGPGDVAYTPNYYLMCECLFITTFYVWLVW